jgi:ADP-ribose pyrophosphatase
VVPVFEGQVVLVRQYRVAIDETILEIPAGKLEGAEEPEHRGRCELEEETGYRAGLMVPIAPIYPSVGYTSEKIHMFLAFNLEETAQRLDFDERAEPVLIPLPELAGRLDANEFLDAKTHIGLRALFAYVDAHPDVVA